MKPNWRILIAFSLTTFSLLGQTKKDKVLLKINNQPVYQSEFIRLFGKNTSFKMAGEKPSIEKDFDLFIDYKLKLLVAKKLRMDTVASYRKEVAQYKEQLLQPYLKDDRYIDSLVRQAYQRSLTEVKASHILIKSPQNAKDTALAYAKISQLQKELEGGADFAELAQAQSEDPSAKINKGDLGYFSVFRMVHPFENAAYETPVGSLSEIFKTRFGYHLLKVHEVRKSMGEMEVAHIMVRDTTVEGKNSIDKVHQALLEGGVFEELAKKYSDDRRSANNGGKLPRFTRGAMPPPFGEMSFSLTQAEKYSKPFRTDYGWHVVKYIKHHPIQSFDSIKNSLAEKVKKDGRSKNLGNPLVNQLRKQSQIKTNPKALAYYNEPENENKTVPSSFWVLKIDKDTLWQQDYEQFVQEKKKKTSDKPLDLIEAFADEQLLQRYKHQIASSNQEFIDLFEEYKNGLLLFDLMQSKVWGAAQKDTLGLEAFFKANQKEYKTKTTAEAIVLRTKDQARIAELQKIMQEQQPLDSLKTRLKSHSDVLVREGVFEKGAAIFPKNTDYSSRVAQLHQEGDAYLLVQVFDVKAPVLQTLDQVKGKVVSDFQNKIEADWLRALRTKNEVKVYKRRVRKLKKQLAFYE